MCKGGGYYFTRHVPNDLQQHYQKPRIVMCLKTRSKNGALKASHALSSKLDDFWLQMRISHMEVPAAELLISGQPIETFTSCATKLYDALEKYCRLKGINRSKQFSYQLTVTLDTSSSIWVIALLTLTHPLMLQRSGIGLPVETFHPHLSGEFFQLSVL